MVFIVLIDAIVRSGGTAAPEANHVPPPPGWRDEDIRNGETCGASADEKKSYSEEQRQRVLRYAEGLKCFFKASPQTGPPVIVTWVWLHVQSEARLTLQAGSPHRFSFCVFITLHRHVQTAGPESNVASHTTGYLLR